MADDDDTNWQRAGKLLGTDGAEARAARQISDKIYAFAAYLRNDLEFKAPEEREGAIAVRVAHFLDKLKQEGLISIGTKK